MFAQTSSSQYTPRRNIEQHATILKTFLEKFLFVPVWARFLQDIQASQMGGHHESVDADIEALKPYTNSSVGLVKRPVYDLDNVLANAPALFRIVMIFKDSSTSVHYLPTEYRDTLLDIAYNAMNHWLQAREL